MSFYDFFDRYFRHGTNSRPPENDENNGFNNPRSPIWDSGDNVTDSRDFTTMFDFMKMTDPFEMHNFFQMKIGEIMKTFAFEDFSSFVGPGIFETPNVPAIEENLDPRDYYLKPGARKTVPDNEDNERGLDTRSEPTSLLDLLLTIPEPSFGTFSQPRSFSSFRSVTRKTVTLPDGTVKTEEIIRNADGSEQRTESQILPDGSNPPASDSSFVGPDFSGLFDRLTLPEVKKINPKDHFLKPGYEKFNPHGEKVDKDLDKQILQSGIQSLPSFTEEPDIIEPSQNFTLKSFTRRTVKLPSGVVESEEIVRNADGTEQRIVTQTLPDGSSAVVTEDFKTESNRTSQILGYNNEKPSFALKAVKDFMDILFK